MLHYVTYHLTGFRVLAFDAAYSDSDEGDDPYDGYHDSFYVYDHEEDAARYGHLLWLFQLFVNAGADLDAQSTVEVSAC